MSNKANVLQILIKGLSIPERTSLAAEMNVTEAHLRYIAKDWKRLKLTQALILIPSIEDKFGEEAVTKWLETMSTELLKDKLCESK
jgi:hypothetical protein